MSHFASRLRQHHRVDGQEAIYLPSYFPSHLVFRGHLRRRRNYERLIWGWVVLSPKERSVRDVYQSLHVCRTVPVLWSWTVTVSGSLGPSRAALNRRQACLVYIDQRHGELHQNSGKFYGKEIERWAEPEEWHIVDRSRWCQWQKRLRCSLLVLVVLV